MSSPSKGTSIPDGVLDVLKTSKIGYLSVTSKKGDLFSYPVAYHYSGNKIYFLTPVGSAKMKFIRANPRISFIVDNKKITSPSDTKAACGAMFQGRAKVFSMARLVASLLSMGPMAQLAKKYPGMFSFYLKGKGLPEERKFHKYRLIRIDPSKIVYWTGYEFGRYEPDQSKKTTASSNSLEDIKSDESKVEGISGLMESADEELEMDQIPADEDWLAELKSAVSNGVLSEDEMRVISMSPLGLAENVKPGELSAGEKNILKKWRAAKSDG
jgi:hypothetical protein